MREDAAYDLFGYKNDNGEPPKIQTPQGEQQIPWWNVGGEEISNTFLIRKSFPDFIEIPCWDEDVKTRKPRHIVLTLNEYQREQIYDKGNAVIYGYRCGGCQKPKFVTLQPTKEVCEHAPPVWYHNLPGFTFNSGPTTLS